MKKLTFFLIFFFISCTSPTPPKWYNKAYNDTSEYIYATGEGKNKQEALKHALLNTSEKISVTIKSSYKSLQYQYQGNDSLIYSHNSLLKIETKTKPLTFTDYKIIKLEKRDKYYILLEINRIKNAKNMCNNTNLLNINTDNLNIFLNYQKIISKLNKKIEELKDINIIYPVCKSKLIKTLNKKKEIIKKYRKLTLFINSKDPVIKNIFTNIVNIHLSNKGKIKIFINPKINYKKIGDYKITTIYLNITLKNGHELKKFYIVCAASCVSNFDLSKQLAYQKCKKRLKRIFNNSF